MVSDPEDSTNLLKVIGLNPCSNGIWSLTTRKSFESIENISLNPCSNGIWSLTPVSKLENELSKVLILVLMEYGL